MAPVCKDAPNPDYIRSTFGTPTPANYVQNNLGQNYVCLNTLRNRLFVSFDEYVTSYEWSIRSLNGNNSASIVSEDLQPFSLV